MIPTLHGRFYTGQVSLGAAAAINFGSGVNLRMVYFVVVGGTGYLGGDVAGAASNVGMILSDGVPTPWLILDPTTVLAASGTGTLHWLGHN